MTKKEKGKRTQGNKKKRVAKEENSGCGENEKDGHENRGAERKQEKRKGATEHGKRGKE